MTAVQVRLEQDHRELEALLERLASTCAEPSEGLRETFNEMECRLMSHMEAEEEYLLPLVEASHPADVERTRVEHARIRQLVSELGLAIELHVARLAKLVELMQLLRDHAAREDETIYHFAGEKASTAVEHGLATMLKTAARSAVSVARSALAPEPPSPERPGDSSARHRAHP